MCGPTAAQEQLQTEQTQFYQQMQQQDSTEFSEQQGILSQLHSTYDPILAAGPNQFGFSQGQTQNLNTTATEGVAQGFAGASRALKEQQAATGGDSFATSGVNQTEQAGLDEAAAGQEAGEKEQIQQAGYQQGYTEFSQASGALENAAAGILNPVGIASDTNSAGSAAASTANQIAAENEAWMAPLTGAVSAAAGAAAGNYTKNFGK